MDSASLDEMIEGLRAAAFATSQPQAFAELARHLVVRYEAAGAPADLHEAVDADDTALALAPEDSPARLLILSNLATVLAMRFERFGRPEDLNRAILLAGDLPADESRSELPAILNTFAILLMMRHERGGPPSDADEAVELARRAVALTAPGDPDLGIYNNTLGDALERRFHETEDVDDIDAAVAASRAALAATDKVDGDLAARLSNLAVRLRARYDVDHDRYAADLDDAISLADWATEIVTSRSPSRRAILSTLAELLSRRSDRPGRDADLDRAIDLFRLVLELAGPSSPQRPGHLNNLAIRLSKRYRRGRQSVDRAEMTGHVLEWAALCERGAAGRHEVTASGPFWVVELTDLAGEGDADLWGVAGRVGSVLLRCAERMGTVPGEAHEEERREQATRLRAAVDGMAALSALAVLHAEGDATEALGLLESGLTTMAVERSGRLAARPVQVHRGVGDLAANARRNNATLAWVAVTRHGGLVGKIEPDGSPAITLLPELTWDLAVDWHERLHPIADPGTAAQGRNRLRGPDRAGVPAVADVRSVLDELAGVLGDTPWLDGTCWLVPAGLLASLPWQARWPDVRIHTSATLHALSREAASRPSPARARIVVDPDHSLSNALIEGRIVARLLQAAAGDYQVAVHSGDQATLEALLGRDALGVLHVGAHGSDEPALKLAGGERLRPEHLPDRPEVFGALRLLFPNCCLSGALPATHLDEAAGFATAAAVAGAGSTLAALWPVDDGTAAAFADRFYEHFARIGDPHAALRHAREVTPPADSDDPSVLAYQLYGH